LGDLRRLLDVIILAALTPSLLSTREGLRFVDVSRFNKASVGEIP
jgi:hypothetical protein